jgi:4-alpha-glucanotransferase
MTTPEERLLHDAARLFNVQTVYYDVSGRLISPPAEAVLRVLAMLGAQAESMSEITDAVRQRRQFLWQRGVEPVVIAWDSDPPRLKLRLPSRLADEIVHYVIELENGQSANGQCDDYSPPSTEREVEGVRYVTRRLLIRKLPPSGYHRLQLRVRDLTFACVLLASFRQAYDTPDSGTRRWGIFCPLYALRSEQGWGAGNFSDLGSLLEFAAQRGAGFVGTLPLLASFLDELFNPSPYAPVSRLFWNEFYLDIERIPELRQSPVAGALLESAGFQRELERTRAAPLVEYRRIMALKRTLLEEMMQDMLHRHSERAEAFVQFATNHPLAVDYAAFRAKVEREGRPWEQWPAINRDGLLRSGDFDERVKNYHLYAQWLADEQIEELRWKTHGNCGAALYLDFPLGVNRDGYDVWREREVFALGASGGAPPDPFFTKGQNWGFPPLRPEALRQQGYRYYIQCVRHHLQRARMLRIDHVMGLHRSYWIPHGFAATDGVYVHSPSEEFYAVLSLESHRHQAQIIGENLGNVPPYVNTAMARHNIFGMQVSQFLVSADPWQALQDIPRSTVASLNTHDTPTFAGFWNGADIRDRVDLGILSAAEAEMLYRERTAQCERFLDELASRGELAHGNRNLIDILRAWLAHLSGTNAALLLVNLEDLWLETAPQNVPGTWQERPNWQRKTRLSLEQISSTNAIGEILKKIDEIRRASF